MTSRRTRVNRGDTSSRENRGPRAGVFSRIRIIVRRFAPSLNKMRLFSCDRDQQYCVKAFHKIRGPRRCNCYRVQVNSDFAQNTVGTRVAGYMNVSARTKWRKAGVRGAERIEGRRHKTSKRFIKYHTAEHCYDTSMQILFCVHEGAINDPLPLPSIPSCVRRISSSLHSSMIENAT